MSDTQDKCVKIIIQEPNDSPNDDTTVKQLTEANVRQHSYSCPWPVDPTKTKGKLEVESRPRSETWDSGICLTESSSNYINGSSNIETDHDEVRKVADSTESSEMFPTSIHLSQPMTVLTVENKTKSLIAGNDYGQIYIWNDTQECLMTTLKVAGKVASLDVWDDFLAVGSGVIQLFNITDTSKRVLYMKRNQSVMVSKNTQYMAAFIGKIGNLVSARIKGSTLDLWPPPKMDSVNIVSNPISTTTLDEDTEAIVSLSSSKHTTCVAVITQSDTGQGLLRIFGEGLKPQFVLKPNCLTNGTNDFHMCFLSTNLQKTNIAVGKEKMLEILEYNTGKVLHTCSTLAHAMTCLSPTDCNASTETKQNLVVGTSKGEVFIFDDELNHMHFYKHAYGIVSTAVTFSEKSNCVYAVDIKGRVQVWNDRSDSEIEKCNILIGKQLYGEGILMQRQFIQLYKKDFSFGDHDIHLHFPQEALNEQHFIEVAFGLCAPCILPKHMIPVSPILWLCSCPPKHFTQPVKITLPHCVNCDSTEVSPSQFLHVLKAEHDSIGIDKNGHTVINFKEVDKKSDFPIGSHQGTIEDHHFCIYCFGMYVDQEELFSKFVKVEYCLTIMKPKSYPKHEIRKIYCIFHYNLDTCKKLVRSQKPEDYDMTVVMPLTFTLERYDSAIQIKLDTDAAEQSGWMISMDSDTEILAESVNFFNYRSGPKLSDACISSESDKAYPYTYPPRFVIEISRGESSQSSRLGLKFIGTTQQPLLRDVQLIQEEEVFNDCYITIMKPKEYPKQTTRTCKINCILHYNNLESSNKLLSDQETEEYNIAVLKMSLTKSAAIELKLEKTEAEKNGWLITMESPSTIFAKDIGQLEDASKNSSASVYESTTTYSGNFVIEVSSREACRSSKMKLVFTGGQPQNLSTEIQLHYPDAQTTFEELHFGNNSDTYQNVLCKPFISCNGCVKEAHEETL